MERGCMLDGTQPYADTIFLRQNLTTRIPDDARRALTLAALAQSVDEVSAQLSETVTSSDPLVAYAAYLEIALSAARSGSITDQRASYALSRMSELELQTVTKSDLAFLRALQAEAQGDVEAALTHTQAAIEQEPRFFNALALDLRLRLATGQHLRGPASAFAQTASCQSEFHELLRVLALIADLEPCKSMAAHLELFLSRQIVVPEDAPGMHAIATYLAVLSKRKDLAQSAFDRFMQPPRPICATEIGAELDRFLDLLAEDKQP
ncbi:hypothetical protein TRP8649_03623 [Pelagimonas phthalicica]|uniref:Tetratricopeptide repeat protein n=2 Tax=Pelagimonas phthalicica TaxID=1037362 RepID=A0A238JH71_9RHOB|nr:hypothetical protein CLV87_3621 [Pelagimonas phthalicica]SMX29487.1 hypothetical protein TRP8649_03623 [Pelagimonas phthalicica]